MISTTPPIYRSLCISQDIHVLRTDFVHIFVDRFAWLSWRNAGWGYHVCMLRLWYCNCAGTGSLIWLWWSDVFCSLYPYKEAKDRRGNEIKLNVFSIVCFGVLLAVDVNYYMDEDEGKEERLAGLLAGWLTCSLTWDHFHIHSINFLFRISMYNVEMMKKIAFGRSLFIYYQVFILILNMVISH